MTAQELIYELNKLPKDMQVIVETEVYSGGACAIKRLYQAKGCIDDIGGFYQRTEKELAERRENVLKEMKEIQRGIDEEIIPESVKDREWWLRHRIQDLETRIRLLNELDSYQEVIILEGE